MRLLALALLLLALLAGSARGQEEGPGFRLDVEPRLDPVFGGVERLKRAVDEFQAIAGEMTALREAFSVSVADALAALRGPAGAAARSCPEAAAQPYARAFDLGRRYHALGQRLEGLHATIRELDDLGETRGLTPDYRFHIARARQTYPQLLRDFAEMRAAFQGQLSAEVRFAGCLPADLVARGDATATPASLPAAPAAAPPAATRVTLADLAVFFVDNQGCRRPQRVVLDGELAGEVAGGARAAFRALVGPHPLCLLSDPAARCGDPGTVRRAVIHDSWTITVRCEP